MLYDFIGRIVFYVLRIIDYCNSLNAPLSDEDENTLEDIQIEPGGAAYEKCDPGNMESPAAGLFREGI